MKIYPLSNFPVGLNHRKTIDFEAILSGSWKFTSDFLV